MDVLDVAGQGTDKGEGGGSSAFQIDEDGGHRSAEI